MTLIKTKPKSNPLNGTSNFSAYEVKTKNGQPVKVHETFDYDKFNPLLGNREVNKLHVNSLVKSMREKFLIVPIVVNEKFEVIDGQHRLEACKELELPVYYIQVDGYGLKETQMLNAIQKNWHYGHYANSYANQGIFDYQEFIRFKNKYGFGYVDSMYLLMRKQSHVAHVFKTGKFKIDNLEVSQDWAKRIVAYGEFYKSYKRSHFVRACLNIFKKKDFDHDRMLQKMSYKGHDIKDSTTTEGYLKILEDIYNIRVREGERVRFF